MAPFNWFNRQHSDSQATSETPPEQEIATPETSSEVEETAKVEAPEAPAVAQDQLAWAKAAYENIRKRKEEEQNPIASSESIPELVSEPITAAVTEPVETSEIPESAEEEPIEAPLSAAAEPVAEPVIVEPATVESVIVEPVTVEPAIEPPPPPATLEPPPIESAVASNLEPSPTESDSLSPPPPLSTPLPFWAQAEAERLERLERLRAEAAAEELEEAAPIPASRAIESTIPDFVLDEAFLWSAEVLAAQGRHPDDISIEEITWLKRLRQGLDKTRRNLVNQLRSIVGQGPLNQDAVMEIESLLLQADVGIEATDFIIESLQSRLREEVLPPAEAIAYLKGILREMLDRPLGGSHSLTFVPEKDQLNIWLITGVNGAGKTTTIGKLAHIANKSGYRCLIAAADTFRAAAVQQVKVWGDRSQVEVIANPGKNTDPAAVVFDGIIAAQSRQTELLLVDTAGRLQNKKNLMDELSKIRRIIDKKAPDARIESLLVLDATLGQNGLRQAQVFSEVAKLSGVVLTKLDGTAKGGIALAVVQQLGLPIRFIGAGEGIEDLRPFSSYEFVEALLS